MGILFCHHLGHRLPVGGWLAWTLVCAEVPYEAATVKIFPRHSLPQPSRHARVRIDGVKCGDAIFPRIGDAGGGCLYSCPFHYGYDGIARLSCRWTVSLKITLRPTDFGGTQRKKLIGYRIIGIMCSTYCLWLIYAGGVKLFLCTSVFYIAGLGFYLKVLGRKDEVLTP